MTGEGKFPKAIRDHLRKAFSSAGYLFRASSLLHDQQSAAVVGERLITLNVNGQQRRVDAMKQDLGVNTTLKTGPDRHEAGMRPR
jgi:hypothetical protein